MNRQQIIAIFILVSVAAAGIYFWLGRGYGELSLQGYAYSKALFLACNQKDSEKLEQISEMIEQDAASGQLQSQEVKWLQSIIELGLNESWTEANRRVRKLMNDQVQEVP